MGARQTPPPTVHGVPSVTCGSLWIEVASGTAYSPESFAKIFECEHLLAFEHTSVSSTRKWPSEDDRLKTFKASTLITLLNSMGTAKVTIISQNIESMTSDIAGLLA
jgi:hypothetical protein